MQARNPRLVYCSVSAYGQHSPDRELPGVDGVVQAVSGLMSVTGMPDSPPCKVQVPVVDVDHRLPGHHLGARRTGATAAGRPGPVAGHQHVQQRGGPATPELRHLLSTMAKRPPTPQGSAAPVRNTPNEALRCADGWIMVAAYHPARWQGPLRGTWAFPELASDPRFADAGERLKRRADVLPLLEQQLLKRSRHEWLPLLQAADIICGPINDYREVVESSAFRAAELAESLVHPGAGHTTLLRSPFLAPGQERRPAPRLGEHTEAVLGGLTPADPQRAAT
jgi:crotonobetainyl-CoA:carnitine CoA-transferase CaiB-like acyl-CoA transferase